MLESFNELLKVTGWVEYMKMYKPVYERLYYEFMSSIKVNWNTSYQNRPIHIQFQLFNRTFDTNLGEFGRRLRLPWIPGHENFNEQEFWGEITCDKCTKVKDNMISLPPHGQHYIHKT